MDIRKLTDEGILLLDGAMGTMLQAAGMPAGCLPEAFGMEHPDILTDIHRGYVRAGSRVISTNTFQASRRKLEGSGYSVTEVVEGAVACAKGAGAPYVALDVGPLDQLLEPMGTMTFEEAYELFAEQMRAGERAGADLILIETVSDLLEAKAAVLAAKETTSLPVICTMTYQEDGRTFVGCDPVTATITLQGLGVDALGVNCSLGPAELLPVVGQILRYASVPVAVQANAGLPEYDDGVTTFPFRPDDYAGAVAEFARMGVRILGGCCGTTPDFITAVAQAVTGIVPATITPPVLTAATSGSKTVFLDDRVTVIGERINPTGKKKLQAALREGRIDYIIGEALSQVEAGANVLDVNVGLPELDEPALIRRVVKEVQAVTNTPLQVDSSDPAAIEAGVRAYNGRPIVNSVNGKAASLAAVLPIVKKYGALVVGLTLDEEGIPPTAEGRLSIARRIVEAAAELGIPREDVLIDCLVLTASAQQEQVLETLRAIRLVKAELGVKTVLGVSNVSFGLPSRERLNAAFLTAAFGAGLDAPILNPLSSRYREAVDCFRVLNNEDREAARFIEHYANLPAEQAAALPSPAKAGPADGDASQRSLRDIIVQGRKEESAPKVRTLLESVPPLEIVDGEFIPALNAVGAQFEQGRLFLPQLMQSADAVKRGFEVIKDHLESSGEKREPRGVILLATVHGDIHDIGKNIVKMMLENYGYEIVDLGKDVPPRAVADAVRARDIRLAGLSALMTTTVQSMKDTIALVRSESPDCRFFVGGAVLNTEYADYVGADYYARDAMEGVQVANRFFGF